jgi:hypothetical protein
MAWKWLRRWRETVTTPAPAWCERSDLFGLAFSVLDVDAYWDFHTATSASFRVEWNGHDHEMLFRKGWIDVHYPCCEHSGVNARLRIAVNPGYSDYESMKTIVHAVLHACGIPDDETYEAAFLEPTKGHDLLQPVDRDGNTRVLVSWIPDLRELEP